jgi:hypothetical protein
MAEERRERESLVLRVLPIEMVDGLRRWVGDTGGEDMVDIVCAEEATGEKRVISKLIVLFRVRRV